MSGGKASGNKLLEASEAEAALLALQNPYLPDSRHNFRTCSVNGRRRRNKTKKALRALEILYFCFLSNQNKVVCPPSE